MNAASPFRGILAAGLGAFALAACDSGLFGKIDAPPLPGERISVLLHERTLVPDPKTAGSEILLPAPSINVDWPQSGGYANHAMHHIETNEVLKPAWQSGIGSAADDQERFVAAPVVAAGRIFAMDVESTVTAFDAATGEDLWSVELTPDEEDDGHIGGGLAFEGGRLYVTTGFAQVIALDAATGAELWRQTVGGPMRTAPTARGGRVFVVTLDNKLYALHGGDGSTLWTHTGIAEEASLLGGASPAVDGGVVVVPYSSGELVALKVENGRLLWQDSLASIRRTDVVSTLAHIRGRPVIDRGRVFAMSHGGQTVSIDLRSGRRIWDKEIGGIESPWVAGNYVFAITNDAEVVCLARDTGRIYWVSTLPRWKDPEDRKDPIIWTGPILVSDRLIVGGSNGRALALSPYSGRILGFEEMPDGVSVAPVVAGGSVFFLSDDAELTAYR
jgi:outer membrane protein assembly factor BamB